MLYYCSIKYFTHFDRHQKLFNVQNKYGVLLLALMLFLIVLCRGFTTIFSFTIQFSTDMISYYHFIFDLRQCKL